MDGGELPLLFGRMALTAGIVVTASLIAERSGPFLGAMVATLPLSIGPAYVFLAMDHGADFVVSSSLASLIGAIAFAPYVIGHLVALRLGGGTLSCIATALAAWAISLFAITRFTWSFESALVGYFVSSFAAVWVTRAERRKAVPLRVAGRIWHLLVRAVAVMVLVALVTLVGRLIGPSAAGSIALMPIVFTSLILLMQPIAGGEALAGILAHGIVGMLSYGPAFAAVHLLSRPLGVYPALLIALAICVVWNAVLIGWRRFRLRQG